MIYGYARVLAGGQSVAALRELAKGKATQADLVRRFNVSRIAISRLSTVI